MGLWSGTVKTIIDLTYLLSFLAFVLFLMSELELIVIERSYGIYLANYVLIATPLLCLSAIAFLRWFGDKRFKLYAFASSIALFLICGMLYIVSEG